ncbi:MAG: hypothetical protein IT303_18160 [Dehalococcoidia bacterium]|nr:hypothetical protein [Dehalococcoidia bacterium]
MFAPSINVDLEKMQQAAEEQPPPRRTAARGRRATPKPLAQPADKDGAEQQ